MCINATDIYIYIYLFYSILLETHAKQLRGCIFVCLSNLHFSLLSSLSSCMFFLPLSGLIF